MCGQLNEALCVIIWSWIIPEKAYSRNKFSRAAEETKQASFASFRISEKHLQFDIDYLLQTTQSWTKETTDVSKEEQKQSLSEKW